MTKSSKEIVFFGSYQDNYLYSRNQELKRAFIELGFNVSELRPSFLNNNHSDNRITSLLTIIRVLFKQIIAGISLLRHMPTLRKSPTILVPYPSYVDILILKLCLVWKRPVIIMDAFLGLYNTIVEDRKLVKTGGLLSRIIRAYEGFVLSLSDKVLIDTQQQADMLSTMYLLPVDKCVPIPVGINETIWSPKPLPLETKQFTAIFWGTFIPLHGIETIVDAARILNSQKAKIQIELIGTGQTANQIQSLLNEDWPENLLWKKKIMPHEELAKYVVKAHCILGIFGMSEKANNVIPYKLYQALALNRPVITRASKTLSSKDQDYGIYTVEPGNAEALANTLINLADNYPPKTKYTPNQFYQQSISNRVIKQRISGLMSSIQND